MKIKYIQTLILAKLFVSVATLIFFQYFIGWDMFTYPDFYKTYNNCTENTAVNILYTQLFCNLSEITGYEYSHRSLFFIFLAMIINMGILISYFKIFEKYLTGNAKILLILVLVIHPYMNIYFFRFYTEIFASLGILMMFVYAINNKQINLFFLLSALVLMNFRIALIPAFIAYGILEIYTNHKLNSKKIYGGFSLLLLALISYLPVIDFGTFFININSEENFFEKIFKNIIYMFGFRESVALSDSLMVFGNGISQISYITSVMLLIIHMLGVFGIFKFAKFYNAKILIVLIYLIVPIFGISHMRYLLPLMPILLFGFIYLVFSSKSMKSI
jgi:hypothetical protein